MRLHHRSVPPAAPTSSPVSVATIAERKSSFNPHSEGQKIADLRAQRDEARAEAGRRARAGEGAARVRDLHIHELSRTATRAPPPHIVRKVMGLQDAFEWLPGSAAERAAAPPPAPRSRAAPALGDRRPERAQRSRQTLPALDSLLPNRGRTGTALLAGSTSVPIDTPQSARLLDGPRGCRPRDGVHGLAGTARNCRRGHTTSSTSTAVPGPRRHVLSGRATHLWGRLDRPARDRRGGRGRRPLHRCARRPVRRRDPDRPCRRSVRLRPSPMLNPAAGVEDASSVAATSRRPSKNSARRSPSRS